jgi:NADP-dependent 3-hydroxy acid dehydrogenase YdfG
MSVFEVRNQHILATGGSSGFGRHFAHFLAGNGAKLTQAARRAVVETAVSLTEGQKETKKPNDFWSEWQDLNLRPLRPERVVSLATP